MYIIKTEKGYVDMGLYGLHFTDDITQAKKFKNGQSIKNYKKMTGLHWLYKLEIMEVSK